MSIGARIRNLRIQHDLSQVELGRVAGVTDKAVSTWEQDAKIPRMGAIEKMASYFGVTKSYIIDGGNEEPAPPVSTLPPGIEEYRPDRYIPVLGRVAAGIPIFADENIEEYIPCDYHDGYEYFSLRAQGDSMTAAGIGDGDYIIVRKQDIVDNGEMAVVLVNGDEATVKNFAQKDNVVILSPQSYNSEYQPQIYDIADVPIRILGKVVEVRRKFL